VVAPRPGARSRAARTAVVGSALALLAHVAAGGRLEVRALGVVLVGVAALVAFAALRRPGTVGSVVGLVGLQLGIHLTAASASASVGQDRLTFLCGAHGAAGHVTTAHLVAMIATHVCATLLAVWWLTRGDAAVVALVLRVRAVLAAVLGPPPTPVPVRERLAVEAARRRCEERSGSVAGRAPPLGSWF
jgi:hypothetical protein